MKGKEIKMASKKLSAINKLDKLKSKDIKQLSKKELNDLDEKIRCLTRIRERVRVGSHPSSGILVDYYPVDGLWLTVHAGMEAININLSKEELSELMLILKDFVDMMPDKRPWQYIDQGYDPYNYMEYRRQDEHDN